MIKQEDFIQVRKLEDLDDLHSDESIYETDSEIDDTCSEEIANSEEDERDY